MSTKRSGFVITALELWAFLAALALVSLLACWAGWLFCGYQADQEAWRMEIGERIEAIEQDVAAIRERIDGHGDSLAVLQRCANSAGWAKVRAKRGF